MNRSKRASEHDGRVGWLWLVVLAGLLSCAGAVTAQTAGPSSSSGQTTVDAATKKLMAANGLYQRGMYKLASEEYAEFLKTYPNHKDAGKARYAYAICQYRLRNYAQVIPLVEQALKNPNFDRRDEAMAVLGHACLATGANQRALEVLTDLLKQFPKSPHAEVASLNRAQVLYVLNRKAEALQACSQFLVNWPDSDRAAEARYLMAMTQQALNQPADAITTLNALLSRHQDFAQRTDAILLLGQAYEQTGNFEEAIKQYQYIARQGPKERQADGLYSMGVAYNRWRKRDQAIAVFQQVLKQYPLSRYAPAARLQLGLAQLGAGRVDQARATFKQVVEKDPDRALVGRYYLAQCDIAEKKYDQARKILEDLAAHQPPPDNLADILYDRAACTFALDQYPQAAEQLAGFVRQYPNDRRCREARYRQAFCLHKMQQYDKSLALCDALLSELGDKAPAGVVELKAENLFMLKRYDQAPAVIEKAMRLVESVQRQRRLSLRLGQCAYFQKNYDRAIEVLTPMLNDRTLKEDINLQRGVFLLGDAQLQKGLYAQAAATLSRYLAVADQNVEEAQFKLAVSQMRNGQPDQAIRTLKELVNGKPDHPWVIRGRYELGQLYYNRKEHEQAEPWLSEVYQQKVVASLRAPALYLLAWIQADAKQYDKAAGLFGKVVKEFADAPLAPDAAYYQAACLYQAGRFDQALPLLQAYTGKFPRSKRLNEARYLTGVCYSRMKKPSKAIEILSALAADDQAVTDKVLYELAWAHRAAKQNEPAIAAYRRLLQRFADSRLAVTSRAELAELLYEKEQYAQAAELLEPVVADASVDADLRSRCRFRLGWCYVRSDKPDKAVEHFKQYIATGKDKKLVASAQYQVGLALAAGGKPDQAVTYFQAIVNDRADAELVPVAMLKLGEVQAEAGRFDASRKTYEQFLARYKDSPYKYLAQFGIGWAMENLKQYDPARQWYAKVIEDHNGPTAARAQFQTGETYFAQGQYERATRELLKVDILYAYPQWSSRALYEAGRAFEQLGMSDRARQQYQQCLKKYKDQPIAALAAKALERLNK